MTSTDDATQGLADVRLRIERAARDAGREPRGVTLVCVSKTFDATAIVPVLAAGERQRPESPCHLFNNLS